jgi:putative transposase
MPKYRGAATKKRFCDEQIIELLKEADVGLAVVELWRKHGFSDASYKWKATFSGMDVSDAKRLRALEEENNKLKRLLAAAIAGQCSVKGCGFSKVVNPQAREAVGDLKAASLIHILLGHEGWCVNVKGVYRLYRNAGLAVRKHI